MKAYLYGSEVIILEYYTLPFGTHCCRARNVETGWIHNVPVDIIEIK